MPRFTPELISKDNWNRLVFDFSQLGIDCSGSAIRLLPDDLTLDELFYPWGGEPPSEYHLKKHMIPRDPSLESTLVCQKHSNYAVRKILKHYAEPSQSLIPHGELLRQFCERHSQPYEYYEFYLLLIKYFEIMCPIPVNAGILPSMSIQILDSIRSGKGLQKTGNKRRDEEIDSINEITDKINKHKQNILLTRFDWYKTAYEFTTEANSQPLSPDESKEVIHLINKKSDVAYKTNNKNKNDRARAKKDNRIIVPELYSDFKLCQCWFCGEFYELPRSKANNYSRHCIDEKCKRSHKNWVTALDRKDDGENPDSIGLGIKKGRKP